jgi:hypothetical protein
MGHLVEADSFRWSGHGRPSEADELSLEGVGRRGDADRLALPRSGRRLPIEDERLADDVVEALARRLGQVGQGVERLRADVEAQADPALLTGRRLIIGGEVVLDLVRVVEGIGQGIVDVGRAEVRILPDDLLDGHAPAVTPQDRADPDARAGDDGPAAAPPLDLLDVAEIDLGHALVPPGALTSSHDNREPRPMPGHGGQKRRPRGDFPCTAPPAPR